jgi:hypothetical protein
VAQALSNQTLIRILEDPSGIVVEFIVLSINKVLSEVVLEGSAFIKNLVNVGVNKFYEIAGIKQSYDLIIEFTDYMLADNHSLDVFLHLLEVIAFRIDVFRHLNDILLTQILIFHQECVSHRPLSEGLLSYLDV